MSNVNDLDLSYANMCQGNLARKVVVMPEDYPRKSNKRSNASRNTTSRSTTSRSTGSRSAANRNTMHRNTANRSTTNKSTSNRSVNGNGAGFRENSIKHAQQRVAQKSSNGARTASATRQTANGARSRKKRQLRKRRMQLLMLMACVFVVMCGVLISGVRSLLKSGSAKNELSVSEDVCKLQEIVSEIDISLPIFDEKIQGISKRAYDKHPEWTEDFLTINEFSRCGEPLPKVKNVFVHYTANPGTTAAQNRSYFESLKDSQERSASAHFVIGIDGEIIQCMPLDEVAYAVQTRNYDSISIECCYEAADGSFTQETYDSLVTLLRWLVDSYHLSTNDILRHYDCGGKKCPLYFVDNEMEWEQLKKDVSRLHF